MSEEGQKRTSLRANGMFALGQKQTCAVREGMSALPPKATLKAFIRMSASSLVLFGAPLSIDHPNSAMLRSRWAEARLHGGHP